MVGAHGDDDQGSSSGSVYAFTRASGNWAQAGKMVASDGASLDYFGVAVSGLSSTSVVVGAYSQYWNYPDLSGPGSAYIFTRSSGNWAQADKLVATDRASNDNFGRSVAGLTSTSFVTGADGDDDQGSSSGSVYAFSMSAGNWAQAGKVMASDAAVDDHFGYSVSGMGFCYCVVGAKDDDNYQGSVYIIAIGGSCNETTLESVTETTSSASIADTTSSESIAEITSESIAETTSESIAETISESIAETTSFVTAGKVVASDGADGDFFGYSVSGLDSTSFVAGATNNDDLGLDSGSVYAFTKSSGDWEQAAKVVASESVSGDRFGNAVSGLSSSSFLVGASEADGQYSDSGSVFIFTRSSGNWTQANKVVASDGAWQDWFGRSVSGLSSTAFVVGAHGDDDQDSKSGSAYIFTMSSGSWTQANKVVASDGAANDYFGVAVSGWSSSSFMVGAHGDDDQGSSSGSVYAFTRALGNWAQAGKMVASDGASLDYFGVAVSGLSSTSVVVGAYSQYWNYPDLSGPGSAYIFTRSSGNWAQADKLVATDRASNDNFGRSVAGLTSTSFVTGADGDDDQGSSSGSVYAFSMSAGNWAQAGKVMASDAAADDHFGYSV
ncbi:unnamed protein product, partial [Heterosigma akashiwo]